jgi:hypothetical protein
LKLSQHGEEPSPKLPAKCQDFMATVMNTTQLVTAHCCPKAPLVAGLRHACATRWLDLREPSNSPTDTLEKNAAEIPAPGTDEKACSEC